MTHTSLTGAASFIIGGTVALSWSASTVLATAKNYIPNGFKKIKAVVTGAKSVSAISIRFVEWTPNQVFGWFEMRINHTNLPISVTDTYGL